MKSLEQKLSASEENQSIISRRETQSLKSVRKYSITIPFDLLIEIFSRVPAKSIARFRCLSKFWASIFVRSDFTELFLTKSSNRPRSLFTIEVNKEVLIFSSPQPHDPEENCCLVATRYKQFSKHVPNQTYISSLLGLVLLQNWNRESLMIYNIITGESITLLRPEVNWFIDGKSFLCYDPVNKQFKVLCTTWVAFDGTLNTSHRVLTLETGNFGWRIIECEPYSTRECRDCEICINGVLYYGTDDTSLIVCFDVRNEKVSYIIINEEDMFEEYPAWTLTNYKGKLGLHVDFVYSKDKELVLWVLEDAVNNKWSKKVCVLSPLWNMIVDKTMGYSVGVTCGGEIVFSPTDLSNPFYIFYYNFERNTFTRVEIQGFQEFADGRNCSTSLNYVENIKLM